MPSLYYPDLDPKTVKNLGIILQLAKEHPKYFEESPYGVETEKLILSFMGGKAPILGTPDVKKPAKPDEFDLLTEITNTYNELNLHRPHHTEDSAMQAYFRTKTSLLEKLLGQIEQAKNQKMVSDFYSTVIGIMEEVLSPTQQTQFIERLKGFQ